MEILEFVFRDFWTWLGTLFLISAVAGVVGAIFPNIHIGDTHYHTENNQMCNQE